MGAGSVRAVKPPAGDAEAQRRERARLAALHALRILDTPDEERFDRITRVAAQVCGVPMAQFTLIDAERQWAKSSVGPLGREIAREDSFCSHDLEHPEALLVPDATADPRFARNPLVTAEGGLRFYAGVVVRSADGHPLGRLCVLDTEPHTPIPRACRRCRISPRGSSSSCTRAPSRAPRRTPAPRPWPACRSASSRSPRTSCARR